MREKDEITGLFRSRLSGTEMTVREGFWEKLREDVASSASEDRKRAAFLSPKYYRVAAAASVADGMRMTCPMRKLSALSPGLASHMALADTLYFTVSR